MSARQLKRVMGITGDHLWSENPDGSHEQLNLYINGGGQLLALNPAQMELQPTPNAPSPSETGPGGPTGFKPPSDQEHDDS